MADSFVCSFVITQGRIKLQPGARQHIDRWASAVGEGVIGQLELKEHKDKRTLRQNRTLWGPVYDQILTQIMEAAGYRPDEAREHMDVSKMKQRVHYGLLAKRFGYETDPITKQQVPATTSSELTTAEMAEYLEWLVVYCADELGIQVILPDELARPVKPKKA